MVNLRLQGRPPPVRAASARFPHGGIVREMGLVVHPVRLAQGAKENTCGVWTARNVARSKGSTPLFSDAADRVLDRHDRNRTAMHSRSSIDGWCPLPPTDGRRRGCRPNPLHPAGRRAHWPRNGTVRHRPRPRGPRRPGWSVTTLAHSPCRLSCRTRTTKRSGCASRNRARVTMTGRSSGKNCLATGRFMRGCPCRPRRG